MKKLTKDEFIDRAIKAHGNKYTYEKSVYINSDTKICVACPIHGDFWITPSNLYAGHGCPKCAGVAKLDTAEFIKRAIAIHGSKYDYSKVKYVNTEEKVCIICPEHGEFWQTPHMHISYRKRGCPICGSSAKQTTEGFIENAKRVHGDKYDYSQVKYIGNKKKVCIICPEHGEFWQKPNSHLRGCGCAACSSSHLEQIVLNVLINEHVKFVREQTFPWLGMKKFDFFLPDYNVAIECQGEQHFIPIDFAGNGCDWSAEQLHKTQERDNLKIEASKANNITLYHFLKNEKYFGVYDNELHDETDVKNMIKSYKIS